MPGRFTLAKDADQLKSSFPDFPVDARLTPRFNIAPTQPVTAWVADPAVRMEIFTWGLIPPWEKDPGAGVKRINARAETLSERAGFKVAYRRKRCLIPVDGWYEWKTTPSGKHPYRFRRRDGAAFAFAGLWEEWHDKEGGMILSCAVITTRPNALVRKFHARMPAVLREEDHAAWLNPTTLFKDLDRMLEPIPSDEFTVDPVSPEVNRAGVDHPGLILPWSSPEQPRQTELF